MVWRDPRLQTETGGARPVSTSFSALEYYKDGSFRPASYELRGSTNVGWTIRRNGEDHLSLGPGYRLLRTLCCGICSTDLDRHFLPFPLPQVIGHELVASDRAGERFVVEINASHQARGIEANCPFCPKVSRPIARRGGHWGYTICLVASGRGSWCRWRPPSPVPTEIPNEAAVLIEPFAAALHAVGHIDLRAGDHVAVLGPRRLGLLVVAALALGDGSIRATTASSPCRVTPACWRSREASARTNRFGCPTMPTPFTPVWQMWSSILPPARPGSSWPFVSPAARCTSSRPTARRVRAWTTSPSWWWTRSPWHASPRQSAMAAGFSPASAAFSATGAHDSSGSPAHRRRLGCRST